MQNLSLAELVQVAEDILKRRGEALQRVAVGPVFRALLEKAVAEYNALPAALREVPMADLLASADARHDGWLRAIFGLREVMRGVPGATPAMVAAGDFLDKGFGPVARESTAPYAQEVQRAADREAKVAANREVLAAVPTPDGGTLLTWVEAYLEAGRALGELLSSRADEVSGGGSRGAAPGLRGRLMGLFSDLRTNVRREVEAETGVGAEVEAALFGYADELVRLAAARGKGTGGGAAADVTEPEAPVEGPVAAG
jgi:hypothetical protein